MDIARDTRYLSSSPSLPRCVGTFGVLGQMKINITHDRAKPSRRGGPKAEPPPSDGEQRVTVILNTISNENHPASS